VRRQGLSGMCMGRRGNRALVVFILFFIFYVTDRLYDSFLPFRSDPDASVVSLENLGNLLPAALLPRVTMDTSQIGGHPANNDFFHILATSNSLIKNVLCWRSLQRRHDECSCVS
jgi:hypothetical protein